MLLTLRDVSVRFGSVEALKKISLTLPRQGLIGLIGPNASGKSTLLDVLAGFQRVSEGVVQDGEGKAGCSVLDCQKTCVRLHQRLVVPPSVSALEYLALAMMPELTATAHAFDRSWLKDARIVSCLNGWPKDLLECARIRLAQHQPIAQLSYGQQRVVALCAVLLSSKRAYLLDEPFAGLSGEVRSLAQKTLLEASATRLVVIAEHDLEAIRNISSELVVLVAGRVVRHATSPDFRNIDLLQYFS